MPKKECVLESDGLGERASGLDVYADGAQLVNLRSCINPLCRPPPPEHRFLTAKKSKTVKKLGSDPGSEPVSAGRTTTPPDRITSGLPVSPRLSSSGPINCFTWTILFVWVTAPAQAIG